MQHRPCQCVFPAVSEDEIATIPGEEPGTALRLFADTGRDGYVRLQQLAYTDGLGWYAQKSMVIHRDVLKLLVPQLRRAMCLMPPTTAPKHDLGEAIAFPRLAAATSDTFEPTGS
jgi:hypothetical protein